MRFWRLSWLLFRFTLVSTGLTAFTLLILALTPLPSRAFAHFSRDGYPLKKSPDYIVVLGGGGIPSESGFMRTYFAAEAALHYPSANVILSLPEDSEQRPSNVEKMQQEIILRGVAADRILLEKESYNTYQQAEAIYRMLSQENPHPDLVIVTSGYHLKRALGTFRKAGFERVAGMPALDEEVKADFGPLVRLRYEFWNNLQYYGIMAREYTAIAVYKAKGWM